MGDQIEGSTFDVSIPHAPDQKFFTQTVLDRLASSAPSCPGTYRCWSPHRKSRRLGHRCTVVLKPSGKHH